MPLTTGTLLGPYEIVAPLGAGGMGEVYRARDTRLGRDVAVKVLPGHLSTNPEVRGRFEREAKAVSSLNHPHICTLHDVGRAQEIDYLVMELIEGETLTHRIARGALPTAEVLRLGAQVADALAAAHRAGVVHRDLKPGNVMLTKSGAKLMDFGLAKPAGPAAAPSALTASPTLTTPLTADGAIVGTFQYMAPEQLEGRESDARSDLFALGCVLYEMASGKRAFSGKTQASLIAAILKEEPPPIVSAEAVSPPALDRLVRLCLRKDPDERIQSAHDVRLQLEAIAEAGTPPDATAAVTEASTRGRARERLAWGAVALVSLVALALAYPAFRRAAPPRVLVSSVGAPEGTSFVANVLGVALSPDGRHLALVARGPAASGLWVRSLDSAKATLLAASEDAECPFWSPDSRWIGFRSGGYLKKADLETGQTDSLTPMRDCLGASWGSDERIYFQQDRVSPILRIAAAGGGAEPESVVPVPADSRRNYSQPVLLPDGKHLLYTVNESWEGGTNSGIYVAALGGGGEKRLLPVLSNARYVEPGYLVYGKDGSLRAQKFDLGRLEMMGEPIPLVENVQYVGVYQSHLFSISNDGLLIYAEGKGTLTRQLTWVDRKGAVLGVTGQPGNYFSPRISHDGTRVAYDQSEATTDSGDIWVLDLKRGISDRLTFDPRNESSPIWSPDDRRLVFFGDFPGRSDLFSVSSDGTGKVESIFSNGSSNYPADWAADGKSILVQTTSAAAGLNATDLFIYSPETGNAEPWLATPFTEKQPRFSPDGRWLAYDSDESGKSEVYVRGYAPSGGKWRVSADGGFSPLWSRDGKELFYISADSKVMSVPLGRGAAFEGGAAAPLFKIPGEILNLSVVTQYDVSPDGQRFLMNLNTPTQGQKLLTLMSNWTSLLGPK